MKEIIGRILMLFIMTYLILIFIRVVISWINLPRVRLIELICKFTDPVLDFFRKNTPIQLGVFDISIIVPVGILYILAQIVTDFMIGDLPFIALINIFYIFKIILIIVNMLVSLIIFLFMIFTIALIVIKIFSPYSFNPVLSSITSIIDPLIEKLRVLFKIRSRHAETIYLAILLAMLIILGIIAGRIIDYLRLIVNNQLYNYLMSIRGQ